MPLANANSANSNYFNRPLCQVNKCHKKWERSRNRIRKFTLQSLSSSVHSNDLMTELDVTLRVDLRQVINFHSQHSLSFSKDRAKYYVVLSFSSENMAELLAVFPSHLMSEYVRMSDTDRDQIDQDAQIFMRTCADAIQQLRAEGNLSYMCCFSQTGGELF